MVVLPRKSCLGVNSIDIGYQNAANTINLLGYQNGVTTIGGAYFSNSSLCLAILIYDDPILDLTGASDVMKGSFNYDNNASYGFENGYLTSYSVNCAVGAIPTN